MFSPYSLNLRAFYSKLVQQFLYAVEVSMCFLAGSFVQLLNNTITRRIECVADLNRTVVSTSVSLERFNNFEGLVYRI